MDLIDEKGNIFGIINILDGLVILIVFSLIITGGAIFYEPWNSGTAEDTVTVNLTVDEIHPYVAEELGPGNYSDDLTVTETSVSPAQVVVQNQAGELRVRHHPTLKTVRLQAELTIERDASGLVFRGKPLRIGQEITVDSGRVLVTANVTDIID